MQYKEFQSRVRQDFKLDLESYKETQLLRRLGVFMARQQITLNDFSGLYQFMKKSPANYNSFLDFLTINVTQFYRDEKMFAVLEKDIMTRLLGQSKSLRIWSAACSNGAEPYSVAIMLAEKTPGMQHRIEATDIDPNILKLALEGRYTEDIVKNLGPSRLGRHFSKTGNLYFIKDNIKSMVTFKRHDLLIDQYNSGYDLIICRNVAIYFTSEAQKKIYSGFSKALKPGGFLFIGGSEMIMNASDYNFQRIFPCFYQRS